MRANFDSKLLAGLIATFALVVALSYTAYRAVLRIDESHDSVIITQQALRKINSLSEKLSAVEDLLKFYLITGNGKDLNRFKISLKLLTPEFSDLELGLRADAFQKTNLRKLKVLSQTRTKELEHLAEIRKKRGIEHVASVLNEERHRSVRIQCLTYIDTLIQTESKRLAIQQSESDRSASFAFTLIVFCTGISVFFIWILNGFIKATFREQSQIQEQLRASEQVFSSAFHYSATGMALVSPEGAWLDVNHSLCEMLGYTKEELLKTNFKKITYPDDLQNDLSFVNKVLNGLIPSYSIEKRYLTKNGQIIWSVLTVSLIKESDGRPKFFIAQILDVTESHKSANENQKILDASIDVICSVDEDGRFVQVSKACERMWGYTPEELVGTSYLKLVVEEDLQRTVEIAEQLFSGTPIANFENRYLRKDGAIAPIIWSATWSEEEKILFCIAKDASEKKRLEQALEAERRRYEEVFHQAPSCIAVFEGADSVFRLANPLYLQLTGKSNVLGKAYKDVFPELAGQGFYELQEAVYRTGEPHSAKEYLTYLDREGDGVLSEMYFDFAYLPYKDEQGKVQGIFAFGIDVTSQVKSRQKVKESEQRYKQLIEEMPGAVYTCDAEGRILLYNKAAAELWGREPQIGIDLWCGSWRLFDQQGNEIPLDQCPMAIAIKEQRPVRGAEIVVAKPSGEQRIIQPHPFPLFDSKGALQGAINMLIDITPHKDAEVLLRNTNQILKEKNKTIAIAKEEITRKALELELSNKYKSEFLANMSHELRTPLNSVLVLASLLSENQQENLSAKQLEYAEIIYKSGSDLLTLINDILDLAKIESGKFNLVFERVALADVVREMEQLFSVISNEKEVQFVVSVDESVPQSLITDPLRLKQILKNLLSNAFKFTSGKGTVELSFGTLSNQQNLFIKVKDNGIGIEEDQKQMIFEAFQQVNGSSTRKYGGTGLGLSITKELVLKLGGRVEVESTPGEGSVFTVTLPIIVPKKEVAEVLPSKVVATVRDQDFKGKKLLIVDDDIRNIYALSAMLEEYGLDYYAATNGVDALDQLRKCDDVNVVLMDIMMPEMDGYEAMREIRKMQNYHKVPIIALTAKAMVGDAEKCFEAGASDYISKPFVTGHLIAQIKHWLEKQN